MRILMMAGLLGSLLAPVLAGSAMAQQPSQAQANAIRQSCRGDYQSYCSSVPPGGQASLQCLQQNLAALSPPCHEAVAAATGAMPAHPPSSPTGAPPPPPPRLSPRQEIALMRRECGGDFRAYCSGVPLGEGRAMSCLMQNEQRLSPQCHGALAQARAAR